MRIKVLLVLLLLLTATQISAQADDFPITFRSGEMIVSEVLGPFSLYQLNPDTGAVEPLPGVPAGNVSAWQYSPDGAQIALVMTDDVGLGLMPATLYIMNADGSDLRAINSEPTIIGQVAWSPDGAYFAYQIMPSLDIPTYETIVLNLADGSEVSRFQSGSMQWSPDSMQIAFLRSQPEVTYFSDLYVADALSGEVKQLTDLEGNVESFAWNPAGGEIGYIYYELPNNDRVGDLWAANPATGELRNVTNTGTVGSAFAWSPDGAWVIFSDELGGYNLLKPDGTTVVIAENPQHSFRSMPPVWSPDGTKAIFEILSDDGMTWTMHVVDRNTLAVRNLTPGLDTEGSFRWLPNSTDIIMMGKAPGDPEIYMVPADGSTAPRQLTARPGFFDIDPIWRPGH